MCYSIKPERRKFRPGVPLSNDALGVLLVLLLAQCCFNAIHPHGHARGIVLADDLDDVARQRIVLCAWSETMSLTGLRLILKNV